MKTAGDRGISIIRRSTIALAFTLLTQLAYADPEYAASWGPEVGAAAPTSGPHDAAYSGSA